MDKEQLRDFENDTNGGRNTQCLTEPNLSAKIEEICSNKALTAAIGSLGRSEPMTDYAKPPFVEGGVKGYGFCTHFFKNVVCVLRKCQWCVFFFLSC